MRRGDGQPSQRLTGRHRRAPERQEHVLSHVLGLVPETQHARGDADDPRIGGAEDLLKISPDDPSSRTTRHSHPVLPLGTPDRPAVSVHGHSGGSRVPTSPNDVHICTAPPTPWM
jgi:hypothetical protein